MGSRRRGIASSTLPKKNKMELQLALLLLAATGVLAQDEDPAAGGEEVCDKQCEESWEYVEFLKEEISTPVTDILTNFKTTLDGEKAVESTMQGVMDVRETILKRIKDLRKGEVPICFGHNVKQEEKLSDFRSGEGGRDEGEDEAVQEQLEQPEGGGRQEGLHQGGPDQLHQQV